MIVLVVTALLPVFAILAYVYFTDPDKEPWQTLLTAFGLGALTIVPAALCESFLFDIFNAKNYPLVEAHSWGASSILSLILFSVIVFIFASRAS